jgi:hypothetical protein
MRPDGPTFSANLLQPTANGPNVCDVGGFGGQELRRGSYEDIGQVCRCVRRVYWRSPPGADIGAPTASADPGAAVSVSGLSVGVGDATASSSFGNAALAFNGGTADASGNGIGNLAIAGTDSSATHRLY